MSSHDSLTLPIIQMGYAEKTAEVTQNQSGVQQQVASQLTAKEFEKKMGQVLPVEKQAKSASVTVNQDGKQGANAHAKKERKKKLQEDSKEETMPSNQDPFAGTIVNLNV